MSDVECPYCGAWEEINHDDGYGYGEDEVYQQNCGSCDKNFAFQTSISFDYDATKADCLNGGEHEFKASATLPRKYTRMYCTACDLKRTPTDIEMADILKADS